MSDRPQEVPPEGVAFATREAHPIGVIIGKHLAVKHDGGPELTDQRIQQVKNSGRLSVGLVVCAHTEHGKETLSIELTDETLEVIDKARAELRKLLA